MKKRMIIIGANGSAYKRTIPALKNSDICVVTAIQSRNEEKLKNTCKEYNIEKYYTNIDEMLEKEDFDLIYIANPPFLHKETIEKCIKCNKPIICEKPLAQNYTECLNIQELLKKYKIPFMVAHHMRHQKAFSDINDIINSGKIGNVVSCFGQWGFNIKLDAPSSKWKLNKDLGGGGTFSDNGIHVIDFILGIFGTPNKVIGNSRLNSFKESYSNETMILIYDDKDVIINSSHTMPFAGNHLLIYGTKGSIEIYNAMSEKSIKQIIINNDDGKNIINYDEENLYKNEVEDFIKYYLNDDTSVCKGTTINENVISLKLIEDMRKNF